MRLRRAVQALLRRRRIDEREASYQDIVWENAMEAYESTPEPDVGPVVDITPYIQARLDAAKEELLLKANRNKRQRDLRRQQRRRRVGVAAATVAAVLVTTGGVSAVSGVATGLTVVDKLLGTFVEDGGGSPRFPGQPGPDDRRATSSTTIEVPSREGRTIVASAYVSAKEQLCFVEGSVKDGSPVGQRHDGGCLPPDVVFDRLLAEMTYVLGVTVERDGTVLVSGYTTADAEVLNVVGPSGPMTAELSAPWSPLPSRSARIRAFLAVGTIGETLTAESLDRALNTRAYRIDAILNGER